MLRIVKVAAIVPVIIGLGIGISTVIRSETTGGASNVSLSVKSSGPPMTGPSTTAALAVTTDPGAGVSTGGDLVVTVPPIPSQRALPGLCASFLTSGADGAPGFQILIGATGGSAGSTTRWCAKYEQQHRVARVSG